MNAYTHKRAANVVYPRWWIRVRVCPLCGWKMTDKAVEEYPGSECPQCEERFINEYRAA